MQWWAYLLVILFSHAVGAPPADTSGSDTWASTLSHIFENPLTNLRFEDYRQWLGEVQSGQRKLIYKKAKWGQQTIYIHHTCSMALEMVWSEVMRFDDYVLGDANLTHGGVAVDIGGNVGMVSAVVGATYPNAMVYAFEPVRGMALLALHTIIRNRLRNVVLHNVGVTHDGARAKWHKVEREFCPGLDMSADVESVTVPQVLSHYKLPHVNFLKIDCEGCEFAVVPTIEFARVSRLAGELHPEICPPSVTDGAFTRVVQALCGFHAAQPWGYGVSGCDTPINSIAAPRRAVWKSLVCGRNVSLRRRPRRTRWANQASRVYEC